MGVGVGGFVIIEKCIVVKQSGAGNLGWDSLGMEKGRNFTLQTSLEIFRSFRQEILMQHKKSPCLFGAPTGSGVESAELLSLSVTFGGRGAR